jgi:hypothetical protein
LASLFAELRRVGQIEGQNLKVESYGREQNTAGLEALATEVVRSNPDRGGNQDERYSVGSAADQYIAALTSRFSAIGLKAETGVRFP